MPGPPPTGRADEATGVGRGRLLLRFGLGLIALTGERVRAMLATSSAPETPPAQLPSIAPAPRHVALGLLLEALGLGARLPARFRSGLLRGRTAVRRLGSPIARARRLLGRAPGAARLSGHLQALDTEARARLARWAVAGAREESEGRALAKAALTGVRERTFARVAESPDLKQVIRDQSEGIAVTAVAALRERSATADGLAEGAVSRLLGRRRRDGSP